MDAAYQIRRAVGADIESVTALARSIENAPRWSIADYLTALSPDRSLPDIAGPRRCFFVAERASGIVGFSVGSATVLEEDVLAELESVAVAETARRAGVGRALCERVIEWAQGQGARRIELEVRSKSEGAIALHSRLGFVATGRRAKYYRDPADDAVLMLLTIGSKLAYGVANGRDL